MGPVSASDGGRQMIRPSELEVGNLLADAERSLGRPCHLLDSWLYSDPNGVLVVIVYGAEALPGDDVVGDFHQVRWRAASRDQFGGGNVSEGQVAGWFEREASS